VADLVRDFRRGAVAVHVLHHAAEHPVHGAWLTEELARHGYRISPGTLYPLLHRMAEAGLIVGTDEVVDGRVLRRYHATRRGKQALDELRVSIRELADEVGVPPRKGSVRARGG
jgi:DNA-binding PadR family transcriptional regulator